jgi:hypothetical protein
MGKSMLHLGSVMQRDAGLIVLSGGLRSCIIALVIVTSNWAKKQRVTQQNSRVSDQRRRQA